MQKSSTCRPSAPPYGTGRHPLPQGVQRRPLRGSALSSIGRGLRKRSATKPSSEANLIVAQRCRYCELLRTSLKSSKELLVLCPSLLLKLPYLLNKVFGAGLQGFGHLKGRARTGLGHLRSSGRALAVGPAEESLQRLGLCRRVSRACCPADIQAQAEASGRAHHSESDGLLFRLA